jgi:hypothetical protein
LRPRSPPVCGNASQKLVLKIVANVLGDFSAKDAAKAMEAAPVLCNLLQSTDKTVRVFNFMMVIL